MKMRTMMLAAMAAFGFAVSANAADNLPSFPIKAAASSVAPCTLATATTPLSCSGFFIGGGMGGMGSNVDIIGNGINGSVFAGGVLPSIDATYQYVQGNWLVGAEASIGYQLQSNATVNGAGSNANGLFTYEIAKVGGNLSALLGNQVPITIPPVLANALIDIYAFVGVAQHQFAGGWANGTASGAGAEFDIGPRSVIDLKYMNVQYGATRSGGLSLSSENIVKASYIYKLN